MTTIREIDDSDLTTDACPQPPRDEKIIREQPETIEKPLNETTNNSIPKVHSKPRRIKEKSKPTSKPIANIINIANCNGVQIGKSITYNITSPSKLNNKEPTYVKTDLIDRCLISNEPVTTKHIDFVSSHVGEGWRDIGRLLNYSEGQIYQFMETHFIKGIKEVVYQLLLDWIQNEADEATVGKLTTVLWDSKQEEVVVLFSKKFSL